MTEAELVAFDALEPVSELDDVIFQVEDLFRWPRSRREETCARLISKSFRWHFERNEDYRRYSDRVGTSPHSDFRYAELDRIPLITSSQFKLRHVRTPSLEPSKVCVSSGTLGSVSRIHRDETTLSRFFGSVQRCIDEFFGVDDAFCLHLGPSRREAGELWLSYVMSTIDLVFPTSNHISGKVFLPKDVVSTIERQREIHEHVVLIGAPIMFLELIEFMRHRSIRMRDCRCFVVITAGGWKRHVGSSIPRDELHALIGDRFEGMPESNIRDFYNMVEMNSIFPECEKHVKHVPPWVRVSVLAPEDLSPAPFGELGVLAFLDPSAQSYPAFVLTDDLARMKFEGECSCGRCGQGVEIVRRLNSVERRGCALKIDRLCSHVEGKDWMEGETEGRVTSR